jgi:hypothetical protein
MVVRNNRHDSAAMPMMCETAPDFPVEVEVGEGAEGGKYVGVVLAPFSKISVWAPIIAPSARFSQQKQGRKN